MSTNLGHHHTWCPHATSVVDISDSCIRDAWSSLTPAAIVALFLLVSLLRRTVKKPIIPESISKLWRPFLPIEEAEALEGDEGEDETDEDLKKATSTGQRSVWRTVLFAVTGLFQTLVWLGLASYHFYTDAPKTRALGGLFALLTAGTWFYTGLRPVIRPSATAMSDLLVVYIALLCGGVLKLGGEMIHSHWEPLEWVAAWLNIGSLLVVLSALFSMPLNIPSSRINKDDIGITIAPDDYTSLFGWTTFSWVYPIIKRGRYTTLNEDDVWNLSSTVRSKPVFKKFSDMKQPSLLKQLWLANSRDLILDFALTFVSVIFQYSSPVFLKLILDSIGQRDDTTRSPDPPSYKAAYIYAVLMFLSTLCKAEADVQHLWYGRRASTRIRSELMAAIYDKALKRKDLSGIVQPTENQPASEDDSKKKMSKSKKKMSRAEKKRAAKEAKKLEKSADEPKAGADVGKIVNLMAGDAMRMQQTISGIYFLYSAPLEITIACILLYQLLGLSAFAGFFVLLLGWPLNSVLSRRSIRIQKGVLGARDKRMGVLNELIGAVKFIKFFAWEDRWIQRALDAREAEMKWMIKGRINSVMFNLLWTLAPILVSIFSFFAYVWAGNELTISTAFTSIALFNLIRTPLNVIPTWIVQLLQAGVALKRISVYLDEEEVDPQVSSLMRADSPTYLPGEEELGLGLEHADLKWNEVASDKKDEEEQVDASTATSPTSPSSPEITLQVEDADLEAGVETSQSLLFSPDIEQPRFELKDINVRFPEGQLTVVTGPTASGKTALLMAVLGEMTLKAGRIIMHKNPSRIDENGYIHSISFAAQTPWLRHQSIKENVLFGSLYDEERYKQVIDACALQPDLEMLEDGDATEIGARGVSLSGGQKARVALARAVYARTKYVLLDDPLSAVDSHTSRYLYEKLLCGPLLANRTVVLVTHHVELVLPGAHYLVRMLDGRIDTQGTVEDLRDQGLLEHITYDAAADVHKEEMSRSDEKDIETSNNRPVDEEPSEGAAADTTAGEGKKPRKLVKEEHRETGGVKWSIYKSYLKASSYWIWGFLAFMVVVVQVLGASEKLWITVWGEAYPKPSNETSPTFFSFRSFAAMPDYAENLPNGIHSHHHYHESVFHTLANVNTRGTFGFEWPDASVHPYFYVGIYGAIGISIALANVLSVTAQYTAALRASRVLFKKLLVTVVKATFRFHDTTPQGRMLNRFGKDIETIDSSLAGSLQAVNTALASFFAAIVIIAVVFPYFLVPALLIGLAYRELAIGYLNTGRDLRRMESNSRSPIFSDFGEVLEGIVTVRAFSAESRFLDNLHAKIDTTTKMWWTFWMTNRWLLLNFDALGGLAVLVTTLFSIATLSKGAGLAGLCITSAMTFTSSVYWACRFWTALELDLNSVERIVEYLNLPQEPPAIIENNRPPAYWPSSTSESLIRVEDLVVKYAPDLPAVLHDVSFTLKAGERVGLLGRTGSGKSTLAMSILRFVDPTEGKIIIDGIDISTIGVHDLRSRLTFIPQDAALFSGTLRDNLDPFGEHTDAECIDVLRRVHMITDSAYVSRVASREHSASSSRVQSRAASIIDGQESGNLVSSASSATEVDTKTRITLDTKVSPSGTNFSQGQRQLIAMARALLRRSAIIVLDEATSSIDFATDAKIQTAIREEFGGSLLLTVAHRLRTVIDYDRLIVLDKGEIAEFDTPHNLIHKENGIFRQMCLKSGTFTELEAAAAAKAAGNKPIDLPAPTDEDPHS
ncbi:multidrug resistance-associated ABC transporter [Ephemerocybe angulata]|uniref:Multidrug resistance-associated ABC transporter n=1 Tax=Ephemerocybe angulata TaxID=980116 RepID=A0A8H6M7V4_9AGAR|nr:multidrug resistance-associated ABC transporter [Tulosesus angulatus]